MPLVIDVSAIGSVVFVDEDRAYASAALHAVAAEGGVVPPLFWYEIRNLLVVGERRGRLTAEQSNRFLLSVRDLPLEIEELPLDDRALHLARAHTLTMYDAAYLEVAHRRRLPLATTDRALVRAANAMSVPVFTPST